MTRLNEVVERLQGLSLDQIAEVSKGARGHYHMSVLSKARSEDFTSCIALKVVPSSSRFGIIHVPREHRAFFPGYRSQFVLETDLYPFVMHLTGGNADDLIGGDLDAAVGQEIGQYLCHPRSTQISPQYAAEIPGATHNVDGSFKRFYEGHPEIQPDDFLVICKRVKPREDRYVLTRILSDVPFSQ